MSLFHLSTRRHDDTRPHIKMLLLVLPPLLVACDGMLLCHVMSRCRDDQMMSMRLAGSATLTDGRRLAVYTNDKDKTNDPVLEPP